MASLLHHMHVGVLDAEWVAFQAAPARDLLHLRELHDAYAVRCADRCMLALDAHLSSLVASLLQSCLSAAQRVQQLMGSISVGDAAAAPSMLWIQQDAAWQAISEMREDLEIRMRYLYKRLKYRAGRGMMVTLYSQLSNNAYYDAQR